ncbi:UNVERIFIED_CONTAM: hypothetical protein K2H54_007749 [Gekko kuhli]
MSANMQDLPALLDRLELRLSEKISKSIDPIRVQLQDIQTSLRITAQTAETALKMSSTLKAEFTDIRTQILVFPDIPQEALLIRHKLKSITEKLRSARVRYRWLQSGHLQVSSQGQTIQANDEDTGIKLLRALKLSDELDPRRSQKRKHIPTSTPEKITRLPIREETDPETEDMADIQPDNLNI